MVKSFGFFCFLPLGEMWKCLTQAKVMCQIIPFHSLPGSVLSQLNPSEACLSVCCEAMISLYLFFTSSYQLQFPVPSSPPVHSMVPSNADILRTKFLLRSVPSLAPASLICLDLGLNTTLLITLVWYWLVAKSSNCQQSSFKCFLRGAW